MNIGSPLRSSITIRSSHAPTFPTRGDRRTRASAWEAGTKKAAQAEGRVELLRQSRALPDRHGSLWERALLGSEALGAGSYGRVDGAAVCEAVREDEQERSQRRRGDL